MQDAHADAADSGLSADYEGESSNEQYLSTGVEKDEISIASEMRAGETEVQTKRTRKWLRVTADGENAIHEAIADELGVDYEVGANQGPLAEALKDQYGGHVRFNATVTAESVEVELQGLPADAEIGKCPAHGWVESNGEFERDEHGAPKCSEDCYGVLERVVEA